MAKRKAKKLTKTGRKRTGSTRGSGKRRSDRAAGARPAAKKTAGRRVKRAKRGVSRAGVTRTRQTRPTARKNVRSRAGAVTKSARQPDESGMPLRDLVRGGVPRSPKAHRPPGADLLTPWSQRRMKSGHGLRSARGTTLYQAQQNRRVRYGGLKFAVPKRG